MSLNLYSQLNGTYSIPGDYPTINSAVTDLNSSGVSGPVIFNVAAGHNEISGNTTITTNTASSVNTVTFQKSGIGNNPLITAASGSSGSLDGIIIISGTDYVTFDGIDVVDAAANSTSTSRMEFGYAVLKQSETNGTQHIVIKNCRIGLYSIYTNTTGIYMNNHTPTSVTSLSVTSADGTNSFNRFIGITIDSAYTGIQLSGYNAGSPFTFYDQNNETGTDASNTINNFGGGSVTANGIVAIYQNGLKIANNNLNGGSHGTMNHTGGLHGIF
ncbi:MAG TPA: hypothetical protein VJ455_01780, partial [Ignavibacteria bacterium]|nr:hypothetical protein [Ignavibacteria bacterium]